MRTRLYRDTHLHLFNSEMINYSRGETMTDTCGNTTTLDKMFTVPDEKQDPYKSVYQGVDFNSPDYKTQIWPLHAQIEKERRMAEQYDDLCRILQQKLSPPSQDHNTRGAEKIKERLRKKLEAKKKSSSS